MDGTDRTDESGAPLSRREVALVALVARGLSNNEIARLMHLSSHTIKHSVERLSQKLGVRNRVELRTVDYPGRAPHAAVSLAAQLN